MTDDLFFVYGSLKSEEWNNYILEDSVLMGPVVTKQEYYLTDCGFPYLIPSIGSESHGEARTAPVYGELWYVPSKEVQASLDALEGVDAGHYERREITVIDMNGDEHYAEAYIPCEPEMAARYPACPITSFLGKEVYAWKR